MYEDWGGGWSEEMNTWAVSWRKIALSLDQTLNLTKGLSGYAEDAVGASLM